MLYCKVVKMTDARRRAVRVDEKWARDSERETARETARERGTAWVVS